MENREEPLKIEIDDSLKERLKYHQELMDKHALNIIRAAAEIEIFLNKAVQEKFVNSIGVGKVTGENFSRLIQLAFALGVIKQKTYESLVNFKGLRNRVAHEAQPNLMIKDILSILLFLGNEVESIVQKNGDFLSDWHRVSLELLLGHIKNEIKF